MSPLQIYYRKLISKLTYRKLFPLSDPAKQFTAINRLKASIKVAFIEMRYWSRILG